MSFIDTLPAGLVVATPNGLTTTCGSGTITAVAGSSTVSLTGGALAGGASCTIAVNVSGVALGTQVNTTSTVSATAAVTGNAATAAVVVLPSLSLRGSNMIGRGTRAGVITFDPGPADSFKQ